MIPVAVRLNPFKRPEGEIPILDGARRVPWSQHAYILKDRPSFTLDPLFHAGCYYVQDSSAMFTGHVFRKALEHFGPGVRVLDLCAAPGGKTTDLAASLRERFGSDWTLVSNEVMRERSRVLDDNVARWGDPRVIVTSVDPAAFASFPGAFDIIVADVPCSGEGMFRKDEGAVEQWSPELVQLCAARQKRILGDVWPALSDGGVLVYSTCTYEDAENDDSNGVTAEQICVVAVEYAVRAYGLMARTILAKLGLRTTGDLGDVVYKMIDAGLIFPSEGETRADFDDVFDLGEELDRRFKFHYKKRSGSNR